MKNSKPISKEDYYGVLEVNYDITIDDLYKAGFKETYEYHAYLVLSKKVNDTLEVLYEVNPYFDVVLYKFSIVKTKIYNIDLIEEYINRNEGSIETPLCSNDKNQYIFFVKGDNNDLLFRCVYDSINSPNENVLRITHDYPVAARRGMLKDHPYNEAYKQSIIEAEIEREKIEEEMKEIENK
ncbi:hypothetical protein GXP67_09840 [Rhodocytophaga rosea]|uniref:Uncharacterized protein n=1 Tax=Rhodocytophaga rosea TaxID=2704465 RepID=A0A6C0GFV2_9BACT|nr:hypothetical protein [Rhodocytophaga rosea]QHT66931.1 hypothetical protein GXP67_09840 [Rhodocytophaga rosea]